MVQRRGATVLATGNCFIPVKESMRYKQAGRRSQAVHGRTLTAAPICGGLPLALRKICPHTLELTRVDRRRAQSARRRARPRQVCWPPPLVVLGL